MPIDSALRMAVRQFCRDEAQVSVHLAGEGDVGIHGRINELQRLQTAFIVT